MTSVLTPEVLRWVLGPRSSAYYLELILTKSRKRKPKWHTSWVFGATLVTFFLAEMGDKPKLPPQEMAAQFATPVLVVIGTTLGMLIADVPAVFVGDKFANRIPMKLVHKHCRWHFCRAGRCHRAAGCGQGAGLLVRYDAHPVAACGFGLVHGFGRCV